MTHSRYLLIAALAGCAGDEQVTDEPCVTCDPPAQVVQVLVTSAPADDPFTGLTLVYGKHPAILGGADGTPLRARAVPRVGAEIRVVLSERIEEKTVAVYRCASSGWTRDPLDCSVCGDDPATTPNEAGRCLDENQDGIPDIADLVPGLATIRCAGDFTYTTVPGDGFYYPSGSQQVSLTRGLESLGPAIIFEPTVTLPANAACTFDLNAGVKDRDGNPLEWRLGSVGFRSAAE